MGGECANKQRTRHGQKWHIMLFWCSVVTLVILRSIQSTPVHTFQNPEGEGGYPERHTSRTENEQTTKRTNKVKI